MLPASALAEIISNITALRLEPSTVTAVLGAVLTPLLRSPGSEIPIPVPAIREKRPRTARQKRRKARPPVAAAAEPTDGPRERAIAALRANPDAPLNTIAQLAGCARSTVVNARGDLAKEVRQETRKQVRKSRAKPVSTSTGNSAATSKPRNTAAAAVLAKQNERRERAQQFLKNTLAGGPKPVSAVEAEAGRHHIDQVTLTQARGDLGVVSSRGAGNTLALQWSLPG